MTTKLLLSIFGFCLFLRISSAQNCDPELPNPTQNCSTAPIVCDLNNFCSTLPFGGGSGNALVCGIGVSIDNPHWISFIATNTMVRVTVQPSNCISSNNFQGIQGAIVVFCPTGSPYPTIGSCQPNCSTNAFTLGVGGNFVIGQQYWILLDGCAGDVCDYEFINVEGAEIPSLADPTEINGPLNACTGTSVTFIVDGPILATQFYWNVGGEIIITSSRTLNYTIPEDTPLGLLRVCLENAYNDCYGIIEDNGYVPNLVCHELMIVEGTTEDLGLIIHCVSEAPFVKDGFEIYPDQSEVEYTLTSVIGCDSVIQFQLRWQDLDLTVNRLECDDQEQFMVELDIVHLNMNDSFSLYINSILDGIYAYDMLPLILGPFEGDAETEYLFVVFDQLDSICSGEFLLESFDCFESKCSIDFLLIEAGACDEELKFDISMMFEVSSTRKDSFDLYINEAFRGTFAVQDLPIAVDGLSGSVAEDYIFRVCMHDNEDCCIEREYKSVCCDLSEDCTMTGSRYKVWCVNDDEFFYILDFDKVNPASDAFTIRGNGQQYGRFNYNSRPAILGPFDRRSTMEYEFIIQDSENEDCRTLILPGEVDCDNPNNIVVLEGSQMKLWSADNMIYIRDIPADGYRFSLHTLDGKRIRDQQLGWPQSEIHVGQLPYAYYIVSVEKGQNRHTAKVLLGY